MGNYFSGKTALVTGGSSGIGLANAKLLSSYGADVWIIARDPERLRNALEQIRNSRRDAKQRFGMSSADVTDIKQVRAAVAEATSNFNRIDILINSAGDVSVGLFCDSDIDTFRRIIEVDYFGTINVTNACLPSMIERRSGYIVNVSSGYGFIGMYGYSSYCGAKFAVRGFTDALRAELKPIGIGVSVVFPQDTKTPQFERELKMRTPVMRALGNNTPVSPESVAKAILNGVSKGRYVILPGKDVTFYWYFLGLINGWTYNLMDFLVKRALRKVERSGK